MQCLKVKMCIHSGNLIQVHIKSSVRMYNSRQQTWDILHRFILPLTVTPLFPVYNVFWGKIHTVIEKFYVLMVSRAEQHCYMERVGACNVHGERSG